MGELYTYNATHLTTVREGSVELTQAADLGAVGSGRFVLDDTDGTQAIVGQKSFSHTESTCSVPLTFRGYISDREYGRDAGTERKPHVGAARGIAVTLVDTNAMLGFDAFTASTANRPAETVAVRGAWLLATTQMTGIADNGRCTFPATKSMDKADYRNQYPGDVLADMALAVGTSNYHVNDWGSGPELTFRDDNASTADSSTLRISNVLSDASAVTLHPFKDATLTRQPGRVYSLLLLQYAKGTRTSERLATATAFNGRRTGIVSNSQIKTAAKADDELTNLLWQHHTEEDAITCTVQMTSAQVNLILPGQRLQAKFSHLSQEGYSSFTYFRVLERTVTPIVADALLYNVRLKLSPQEAAPPAAAIVQSAFGHSNDGTTTLSLANPVTVGNLLVFVISAAKSNNPTYPNTGGGNIWGAGAWTKTPNVQVRNPYGTGERSGVAIWTKTADSTSAIGTIGVANSAIGIYEISGADIASATTTYATDQTVANPMSAGSLGSPGALERTARLALSLIAA